MKQNLESDSTKLSTQAKNFYIFKEYLKANSGDFELLQLINKNSKVQNDKTKQSYQEFVSIEEKKIISKISKRKKILNFNKNIKDNQLINRNHNHNEINIITNNNNDNNDNNYNKYNFFALPFNGESKIIFQDDFESPLIEYEEMKKIKDHEPFIKKCEDFYEQIYNYN